MNPNRWLFIFGAISVACLGCVAILFIGSMVNPTANTPSPTVELSTLIAQTAGFASTQTALVMPTLTVTQPTIPTPTIIPAASPSITPTETPLPTETIVVIIPTLAPPQVGVCSCTGDLYNCRIEDFSSHDQAQACYNYCISQSVGDIHQLDGADQDGLACEGLP